MTEEIKKNLLEHISKLQDEIDRYNQKENDLFAIYKREKESLTDIGKIQLKKLFEAEIKRMRYYKKRAISSLKITKKRLDEVDKTGHL